MGRWWSVAIIIALVVVGLLNGCELGWDFLKEEGGGGSAGAQTDCQKLSAFALAETGCG